MSLHLNQDAPADFLESILNNSEFIGNNKSIYISQVAKEHGYSVPFDKGLYISFSTLNTTESYFVHGIFKLIASVYGESIINPQDGKFYKFYNYDSETTLLINEKDYLSDPAKYKDFSALNGNVVSDDYVEDIYESEDNNTMDNIKSFAFDYIKYSPPKREPSLSTILINLITDENKILTNIFQHLKDIEQKLIENKKTF